ncbi:MAG TPA: 50S ribosomal protein L23 [Dehalococcoidia bacterium]|jgi:large subunit ribosomal protein L23|nr:50S ribosomal protein L23 [Dehalococcoidia bacterium]
MNPSHILQRPLITEKNTALQEQNKYVFEVAPQANKLQIKEAVEEVFHVTVTSVRVMAIPGKRRRFGKFNMRKAPSRKAVVTLKAGDKIQFFEGV